MRATEQGGGADESAEEKEGGEGMVARLNNLKLETAGTKGEAAEGLVALLEMEVQDAKSSEGKEGDDGTLRALGALEFLTQDADPSGTTLVDARNGFNEMIRLAMLWTVRHRWPSGARFAFN